MSVQWTYKYGDNTIVVKNEGAVELLVNNEIQDKKEGIRTKVDLSGKLKSG